MKRTEVWFLALPVAVTLFNVLFAAFFCSLPRDTGAQNLQPDVLPVHQVRQAYQHVQQQQQQQCAGVGGANDGECSAASLLGEAVDDGDDDEEDPMLRTMPGYGDFKAYVRADVSTFYGEDPGSRQETTPSFRGQAFKVVNMRPDEVDLYWVANTGKKQFNARIKPWSAGGTASFPGHNFVMTKPGNEDEILCRVHVEKGTSVYFCDPFRPNDYELAVPAQGTCEDIVKTGPLSLDTLSPFDRSQYDAHVFNLEFGEAYKNFTGGAEWLTMFPRTRPTHKIWRADYYGQEHTVSTRETHFTSIPDVLATGGKKHKLTPSQMGQTYDHLSKYREPGTMNMTIKALSCAPRAFEIRNFLSDAEVDHILDVIRTMHLERSTTAGHKSETRTSKTTWIPRNTDHVINSVLRRAADALRMDEALLRERVPGELDDDTEALLKRRKVNEDLQIVHYDVGQQYTAHHDFGYPKVNQANSPSRSINRKFDGDIVRFLLLLHYNLTQSHSLHYHSSQCACT